MKKIFTTVLLSLPVLAMAGMTNVNVAGNAGDAKNPAQGKNSSAAPCATYPAPTASPAAACPGIGAELTAVGTGTTDLQWFTTATGGTPIHTGATLNIENPTATTTYWVEENELTGCPENARTEVVLTVHEVVPAVVSSVSGDTVFCNNVYDVEIELTVSAAAGSTFAWGGEPTLTTQNVTYSSGGIYGVTVTDANGCTSSDEIWLRMSYIDWLTVTNTAICEGETETTIVAVCEAADAFEWATGETTAELTVSEIGHYSVTATNEYGCEATYDAEVFASELPEVSAGDDQTICGTQVMLMASGTDNYVWDNEEETEGSVIIVTESGTYTVTGTDYYGCSNSDEVVVVINEAPAVDAGAYREVCAGTAVTLTATVEAGTDIVWNNDVTNGTAFTPTETEIYTVTVTNANECEATDTVTVKVNPMPVAVAALTGAATLNALPSAGQTYQWINCATNAPVAGATASTFVATANGSYKVVVSNGDCDATSNCVNVTTLGIAENTADLGITLFPNPTTGKVFVSTSNNEAVAVTVYNAQGAVVADFGKVQNGEVIELTNVEAGIYVIRVATAQGTAVSRIVKN